jgi:C-terminal processing protease CtpA/Prc
MEFRTNAIHIGDRILAINDVSLRGKGLNEAIKLLQTSSDEITLKISRIINSQQSTFVFIFFLYQFLLRRIISVISSSRRLYSIR